MSSQAIEATPTPVLGAAPRLAIGTILGYQFLSLGLIFLRPDLDPSWHTISEWARGPFGWLMSTAFLLSGVSYASLFAALRSEISGISGRVGLGLLLICAVSSFGVGIFTTDPMTAHSLSMTGILHIITGSIGLVLLPFGALLISLDLARRNPAWTSSRRIVLVAGALPLCGFLGFMAYTLVFVAPLGPRVGPGVNIGWPPRFAFFTYMIWVVILAARAIVARRDRR